MSRKTKRNAARSCAVAMILACPLTAQQATTPEQAGAMISRLSHDSLQGRFAGSAGAANAARMIAVTMRTIGLEAGGDGDGDNYLQRVPLHSPRPRRPGGPELLELADSFFDRDTFPMSRRRESTNVIGILRGSDPELRREFVVIGAHYDHVGMDPSRAVAGDSIWNGADDNASGVVAMIEAARQLREGGAPKRSVIFVAFTAEESGLLGSAWYTRTPRIPMSRTVAALTIEMIGRPDSLIGGWGRAWLTGYERSTMGPMLAQAGIPVVADPRKEMDFFARSDNFPFAIAGVPAHAISSYGGHADYHAPSDEVGKMDLSHLATMIDAIARAVRVIADGPRVEWLPGGRP
jgi:hypothetical protein